MDGLLLDCWNNQSRFRLLEKNIPPDTDAGGIYNKKEANIRVN